MTRTTARMALVALATTAGLAAEEPTPEPPRIEEVVVVSASKAETDLLEAPATVSVLEASEIALSGQRGVELLRGVPGVNLIRTSARDWNLTTRQATRTTSNEQLVLLDGRPLNIDFLGVVAWDLIPVSRADIERIEVVRGPAAVVWGAGALTGVVHVATRSPRDSPGTELSLSGGLFGRDAGSSAGEDPGSSFTADVRHARPLGERWALRLSGGYTESDAFARPAGGVPAGTHPLAPQVPTGGGQYPPFQNEGIRRPRGDVQLERRFDAGSRLVLGGGYAATDGLAHTPIGPFQLSPWKLGYARAAWERGQLRIAGFANLLRGDGPNLLSVGPDGQPVQLEFDTATFDLELRDARTLGERHLLSYGGNLRHNDFGSISTSPAAEDRLELGAYLQDQIFLGDWRLVLGARVDSFEPVDGVIVSPRVALLYRRGAHSLRASFNRAFRSPAATENWLDITSVTGLFPLGAIDPAFGSATLPILTRSVGSPDLREEALTALELAWTGAIAGRTLIGVAVYQNDHDEIIRLSTDPGRAPYTSANPPPGWPLPPFLLDVLASQGVFLPAEFRFLNLGSARTRGLEASLEHRFDGGVTATAGWSWQDRPEPHGSDPIEPQRLNVPPRHRASASLRIERPRFFGGARLQHTSGAFFADVLGPDLWGPTEAFTLLDVTAGVRLDGSRWTLQASLGNLLDQGAQQHVFGDVLKRSAELELRLAF